MVKEIVGQTMTVIVYGATVGWILAFGAQGHLAPNEPLNKLAFWGAPALLLAVSNLASWISARRAARIDPMESLRED